MQIVFHIRLTLFVFALVISALCANDSAAQEESIMSEQQDTPYVIGINDTYMHAVGAERIQALFDQMYRPLGIQPQIQFFPSRRALQKANRGELDAEAGRVKRVAEEYQNLLMIPEAMIRHEVGFFCLREALCQKGGEFRIGMIRGFRFGPHYCAEYGLNCLFDESHALLVSALQKRAIDSIVGSKTSTLHMLCRQGVKQVYYREEPDANVLSFHLVNKRHADKIDALSASIRAMHAEDVFTEFDQQNAKIPAGCEMQVKHLASFKVESAG